MDENEFSNDPKTKAAVERELEIIGEALNRIKKTDLTLLEKITDWREIIGFRNVIAHGYDVVDDQIVWDSIKRNIPVLLIQLNKIIDSEI